MSTVLGGVLDAILDGTNGVSNRAGRLGRGKVVVATLFRGLLKRVETTESHVQKTISKF